MHATRSHLESQDGSPLYDYDRPVNDEAGTERPSPSTALRPSWASSDGARRSMLGNRGRDTKPELAIRRAVHARGLRYRVSVRPITQVRRTADLVFTRAQVAVFVDGCFWHRCPEHATRPKAHAEFWSAKIDGNAARDRETDRILEEAGWTVIRIWEHEPAAEAASRVESVVVERQTRLKLTSGRR